MSETELSRVIQAALRQLGCMVIRVQSGSIPLRGRRIQLAENGTPDLLVLGPGGVTTWIECKTKTGKLREDQVAWHEKAIGLGHRVIVARSVDEAVEGVRR